jgi:hypothetical protein
MLNFYGVSEIDAFFLSRAASSTIIFGGSLGWICNGVEVVLVRSGACWTCPCLLSFGASRLTLLLTGLLVSRGGFAGTLGFLRSSPAGVMGLFVVGTAGFFWMVGSGAFVGEITG